MNVETPSVGPFTPTSEATRRYSSQKPTPTIEERTRIQGGTSTDRSTAKPVAYQLSTDGPYTRRATSNETNTNQYQPTNQTSKRQTTKAHDAIKHDNITQKPTATTYKQTKPQNVTQETITQQSTRRQPNTGKPPVQSKRLRSGKAFRCPCSECKWQTGKSTCRSHYGCFSSQVKHADGRVTVSYGCLENEEHYTLLCNVRKPDQREPKMLLECCRGHKCNFDDILANPPTDNNNLRGRTDVNRTLPRKLIPSYTYGNMDFEISLKNNS